jgi:hypothetical protein
LWRRLLL